MRVLVLGGGGREHALIWKLKQNPEVKEIFCSPGNGGISRIATVLPGCAENDWDSYAAIAAQKKIDLTVIGPEIPLAQGIADTFRKKSLKIFGPDGAGARLESSKIFAKTFMRKYGIPTANSKILEHPKEAQNFLSNISLTTFQFPLVIKADGLAQGKGVMICSSQEEAAAAVEKMMVKKVFGSSGEKILIEEKLEGKEVSLLAFCDGKTILTLPPARDYKRIFDGDRGPNTGGMGSVAPVFLTEGLIKKIDQCVLQPFLKGVQNENLDYRGVIYFGLMMTSKGPYVLEFNVRFGDPETQSLMPLLESDLYQILEATAEQKLNKIKLEVSKDTCVGVVCASAGYPESAQKGKEIIGLDGFKNSSDCVIFHAGTVAENGKFFTNGGRVLNVVGKAPTLEQARDLCYKTLRHLQFEGIQYRRDIGQ